MCVFMNVGKYVRACSITVTEGWYDMYIVGGDYVYTHTHVHVFMGMQNLFGECNYMAPVAKILSGHNGCGQSP